MNFFKIISHSFLEQPKCGVAPLRKYGDKGRVIGGESAKKSYYPWQVALEHYGKFICGGTLISEQHVMTAAHCFNYRDSDPDGYLVIVGEHNRDYSESKYSHSSFYISFCFLAF